MHSSPLALYSARVARGELEADAVQAATAAHLDRLYGDLLRGSPPRRGWRRKLGRLVRARERTPTRGIYLWGGVGRGKTLLLDLFYGALPFKDKTRQHFHRFMASVHADLRDFKDEPNPLEKVADRVADRTRIICFDELVVSDIADAMILGNLFTALFTRGVTLAATSNIRPQDLYRNGLQRAQFLPAIDLILRHTDVVHVEGLEDYRLRVLERADVYQYPSDTMADKRLSDYFDAIAPDEPEVEGRVEVLGRAIEFRRHADGVVWFDFGELCDGPRSQDDYIELARCYQTVVLSNIPQFDSRLEDQARRFIALVDEFYDRRVKLIASAAVAIDDLYRGNRLGRDFQRTRSRLQEMQSYEYLSAAHRP